MSFILVSMRMPTCMHIFTIKHYRICKYICESKEVTCRCWGSSLMPPPAFLALLAEGFASNFLGLGCPIYCTQPALGLLGFTFLTGWILGFLCFGLGLWWLSGLGLVPFGLHPPCPPVSRPGPTASRARVLSAYLHEPGGFQRARDR